METRLPRAPIPTPIAIKIIDISFKIAEGAISTMVKKVYIFSFTELKKYS